MESVKKKLFTCFYELDVFCQYRTTVEFGVMARCEKCPHYARFWQEIEEEEEKFWDEVGKILKYSYSRGIG